MLTQNDIVILMAISYASKLTQPIQNPGAFRQEFERHMDYFLKGCSGTGPKGPRFP